MLWVMMWTSMVRLRKSVNNAFETNKTVRYFDSLTSMVYDLKISLQIRKRTASLSQIIKEMMYLYRSASYS